MYRSNSSKMCWAAALSSESPTVTGLTWNESPEPMSTNSAVTTIPSPFLAYVAQRATCDPMRAASCRASVHARSDPSSL